jgi:hypothetical protein
MRGRFLLEKDVMKLKGLIALLTVIAALFCAKVAHASTLYVPHYHAWICIHHHEAAWSNPGIDWLGHYSGYYGGLQMDKTFMRTYAPRWLRKRKGWANHWSPRRQMWVAERAYRSRGFYPWYNTAHLCGLI